MRKAPPSFRVFNKTIGSYRVTSGSHKHKFRNDMFYVEPGNPNFRVEMMARCQGTINGGLFWMFAGDIIRARTQKDQLINAVVFVSDTEGIYADSGFDSYDLVDLYDIRIIGNANVSDFFRTNDPEELADVIKVYREENYN